MIFGVDTSIVVAVISLITALLTAMYARASNKKVNTANAKKLNAEADTLIYDLQNQAILNLQDQINQLKKEVDSMRKQEHIHVQEKIRLEEKIFLLRNENTLLKENLKLSNKEISELNKQIKILRSDLSKIKFNDDA